MPVSYAETRNIVFLNRARPIGLFTQNNQLLRGKYMSRTIKAIERHMTPPSKREVVERRAAKLVGEWQQRGQETLSRP